MVKGTDRENAFVADKEGTCAEENPVRYTEVFVI